MKKIPITYDQIEEIGNMIKFRAMHIAKTPIKPEYATLKYADCFRMSDAFVFRLNYMDNDKEKAIHITFSKKTRKYEVLTLGIKTKDLDEMLSGLEKNLSAKPVLRKAETAEILQEKSQSI